MREEEEKEERRKRGEKGGREREVYQMVCSAECLNSVERSGQRQTGDILHREEET